MPELGDYFVSGTGFGSSFLSGLQARVVRWGTYTKADKDIQPKMNHAGIYIGNGQVVEAMPGGAILSSVDAYLGDNTLWSNGQFLSPNHTDLQRVAIADFAKSKIGVPYSWGDIVAVILGSEKGPTIIKPLVSYDKQSWLAKRLIKRLIRDDRLICSQLVDMVYHQAGIQLFNDGRIFGEVAPSDIHKILL